MSEAIDFSVHELSPLTIPLQRTEEPTLYAVPDISPVVQDVATAGFAEYRLLCDEGEPVYRKIGISEKGGYEAAISDERTIFAKVGNLLVPAVVALEHEHEYDAERSRRLMDGDPMLLSLPVQVIGWPDTELLANDLHRGNDIHMVISHDAGVGGVAPASLEPLGKLGEYRVSEFVNPEIPNDAHNTAWLAIYSAHITPRPFENSQAACETFGDAWTQHCQELGISEEPGDDAQDVYLLSAELLRQRTDIVDELWDITQIGFGDKALGAYHPVAMEEGSRDTFEEVFLADNTYTAVQFKNGRPVCFGAMTFDAGNWPWVNQDVPEIRQLNDEVESYGETPVYFSALIAHPDHVGSSPAVLSLAYEMTGRLGRPVNLIFESTNLSSMYVPRLVELQARRSPYASLATKVREVGRVAYRHVAVSLEV